jgi:hydrogenase maturation factor
MAYLDTLLQRYGGTDARLIAGPGIGEDVAVIDMGARYLVVKTDPITFATDQIGWYAVNVNANDIATSGARPLWMLNTILLPAGHTSPTLVESIFAQLHDACQQLGIVLVGGHTEVTWGIPRPIVVGVMIGEVAKERLLTTAGARLGDQVWLVKGVPIEATAIIAREKADDLAQRGYSPEFIAEAQAYLYDPGISVVDAAYLAADCPGVHAMHDPTEGGIATGLCELALAAGTGIVVHGDQISILPHARRLCAEYQLDPLGCIASGALIVAVAPEHAADLEAIYAARGVPARHIGDLVPRDEGMWLVEAGERRPLPSFGSDEITRLF